MSKKIYRKLTMIELEKIVNDVADNVFSGNTTPWVIFPSIPITKEDLINYRKLKENK